MAMLAERRKKSKFRVQPFAGFKKYNQRIDGDSSSYGFRLMANMGWAPGKGLGADESGDLDPVVVRLKNDTAGIGHKVSERDAISQQSEFQALLEQLSSGTTNEEHKPKDSGKPIIKSLEKISEQSTRRVHYKKFTRGKDLSRASDQDLKSILGLCSSEAVAKVEPEQEAEVVKESSFDYFKNKESSYDYFKNKGSSVDYFKSKIADIRKKKQEASREDETTKTDTEDFNDSNPNKRRSVTWGEVDVSYVEKYIKDMVDTSGSTDELADSSVCVEEPTIKKKKKKQREVKDQAAMENQEEVVQTLPPPCKEKKKKKKDVREESFKENINVIEDVDCNVHKKKKKRKMIESQPEESPAQEEYSDVQNPKMKKDVCEESFKENVNVIEDVDCSVPKKKKKRKMIELQLEESPAQEAEYNNVQNSEIQKDVCQESFKGNINVIQDVDCSVPKKKKKRKIIETQPKESPVQEEEYANVQNVNIKKEVCEESCKENINVIQDVGCSASKKKKKRKIIETQLEESPAQREENEIVKNGEMVYTEDVSATTEPPARLKKKKKKKDHQLTES